jgi:hypothetical protein
MQAQSTALFLATVAFVCSSLPQAAAQSSARALWDRKQVAGEYSCRWINPDGTEYNTKTQLNWWADSWPKQFILSPNGTWHAFNAEGKFQILFSELELGSANWAGTVFAGLVGDKQSRTAIAVYLPGWCGNDAYVRLAIICEKAGHKFDGETMLEARLPDPHRLAYFTDFLFWRLCFIDRDSAKRKALHSRVPRKLPQRSGLTSFRCGEAAATVALWSSPPMLEELPGLPMRATRGSHSTLQVFGQ